MQVSARITVKGTRYYEFAELLKNGFLAPGVAIRLEHQPLNPQDLNAVAVRVQSTGAMLGHIPKDLAPKYAALVIAGKIISAKVSSIAKSDRVGRAPGRAGRRSQSMLFPFERRKISSIAKSDLTVKVLVIYEQSDELSIGVEKGPPIGMEKGPLLIIGSGSSPKSIGGTRA